MKNRFASLRDEEKRMLQDARLQNRKNFVNLHDDIAVRGGWKNDG